MSRTDVSSPPGSAYTTYVLVTLLLAYILSFIDRNVLAMLVGPIRQQFDISDFQFSILHGWAFTLFYIFLGLPIGWLADRYSRKWIITGGVFFWSLMTCLCGLAGSFYALFVTRVGVGVGEAALSPPAYSMMADYFSARRLRWATSVFTLGITIGSGTSYMIGGSVYDYLEANPIGTITGIEWLVSISAWQATFIAVGLPGLIVVLMLLAIKEPQRQGRSARRGSDGQGSELIGWLRSHWQVYFSLVFGVSMMAVIGYGTLTWYPEFLQRSYAMPRTEAGQALGWIFLIAGSAGTLSGAFFAERLQARGYLDANMRMVMLAAAILIVPAAAAPLMPSADLAILLTWPIIFVHYTHFGVAMAALNVITPNHMRAQISALMLFSTNLFGLALGGSFVAFFTDFVYAGDEHLNYSLATVAAIVYPLAVITIAFGLSYYRNSLKEQGLDELSDPPTPL
ncbi:MAG: MFS transporter [Pseudomonadales bacterium]